jgi:hypothetical protein
VELSGDQRLAQLEYLGDATPFASRLHAMLPYWPLFENLNLAEIGLLSQFLQVFRAQVGQEVIREGDAGDFMMFVIEGSIQVFKQGNNDAPRLIAVVGAGKTLGEMSLIDGDPRSASCIADRVTVSMKIGTPLSPIQRQARHAARRRRTRQGSDHCAAAAGRRGDRRRPLRKRPRPSGRASRPRHFDDRRRRAARNGRAGEAALIVPEIEAIATDMLVEIEAAGLAEVIPTARAAKLTMNREGIRRLAAEELGLPTSPYRFADSLAELQAAIDGEVALATRASSSR